MKKIELETERIRFRMLREDDFDVYERMCSNIEIMRYLGGKTFDRVEAWRHLAYMIGHWELRGFGYFAAEEKSTGRFIGRLGFTDAAGWPGFELGWTLWPEFQGKGYATEGARMLMDYAFRELDRPHVISLIHPENVPSQRVAERLGMKVEGETTILKMPVLIYGIDRPAR